MKIYKLSSRARMFILVLLESCLQTCMTYTIAECAVKKLLMMDRGTVRNRFSCQNKFVKLVHLVGFIIKKTYCKCFSCLTQYTLEVAFEYDALCRKQPTSQVEDEPFVTVYSQYTASDATGLRISVHYIIQKPNYIDSACCSRF